MSILPLLVSEYVFFSQLVEEYLGADVHVGAAWYCGDDVRVVLAAEALVLEGCAMVDRRVKVLRGSPVEQPVMTAWRPRSTAATTTTTKTATMATTTTTTTTTTTSATTTTKKTVSQDIWGSTSKQQYALVQ